MQNPFTTTFSKTPEYTYVTTEGTREIIENFSYDRPSESVFKITGVRGSGKTVLLAKVEEEYKLQENRDRGWIVCRLIPVRDMLRQFAAQLRKEGLRKQNTAFTGINVSASVLGTGGSLGISQAENDPLFDIGVELEDMLQLAAEKKRKILIGIDEISRTKEMIEFALEFGKWLRAGYPVYLVCTGLYENIQELSNVKNLTFFRRATTIQTEPLSFVKMSEIYRKELLLELEDAKLLASITKGYAYAFQLLGVFYFRKRPEESISDVTDRLKSELFAYSYEKIWEKMTETDRFFASLLTEKEEYSREEVLAALGERESSYSVYRDRLLKRGILLARRGYIGFALPFFGQYIREYGTP